MSEINKDELYQHLSEFLKNKGVVLQEGAYTRRIQQGCALMAETANRSQEAFGRAKAGVSKGLDQVRQVIHEKTAPKPSATAPAAEPAPEPAKSQTAKPGAKKGGAAKTVKPVKRSPKSHSAKGASAAAKK